MKKQNSIRRSLSLLLFAALLLPVLALHASAELIPGMDGAGGNGGTEATGETSPGFSAPLPGENGSPAQPSDGARAGDGALSDTGSGAGGSSVWGILIAVGIAALAVTVIFLVMPRREDRDGSEEEAKRR